MRYVWGAAAISLALAGVGVACSISEGGTDPDAGGERDAALDVHLVFKAGCEALE